MCDDMGANSKKISYPLIKSKNLSVSANIGITKAVNGKNETNNLNDNWTEPMGPTPKPYIPTLRDWDFKLLKRYPPFYMPICDMCCLCTFGKCDLSKGKKGACGLNAKAQQARIVLIACTIGTACHAGHSRHMIHTLIERLGEDYPINLGNNIEVEAPIIRTVMGIKPKTLKDLEYVITYCEEQISHLLSSTHTGQEGSYKDFESKSLHAGMIDDLAREAGDLAQIVGFNLPKGDIDAPLIDLGMKCVDASKPNILCIGHNMVPGVAIIDYMEEQGIEDQIEISGICCSAIDISRYSSKGKIIGPLSKQLLYIRGGIADVVVVDEQCIRTDIAEETLKTGAIIIATNEKMCLGLENISHLSEDEAISYLLRHRAGLILEEEKVGKIAVELAKIVAKERKNKKAKLEDKYDKCLPENLEEVRKLAETCTECEWCDRSCANSFKVMDAMIMAKNSDFTGLRDLYEVCYSCGRCEEICERDIPIVSMLTKVGDHFKPDMHYKIRAGRGPVQDIEIRNVGAPIVFGDIPGVIALVGCSNYPNGDNDLVKIVKEFLERKYIVLVSGCAAMSVAAWKDKDGKTLYEKYPGEFKGGGLINVGSCLSNCHITGACIKVANVFAKLPLRGNYAEVADYILNKVGAVGIAWGAMSQKAASIATGVNRWGIPVIVGPHSVKYRRMYLSEGEDFEVYDKRKKKTINIEPVPEHLIMPAENLEEIMCAIPKMCMRPNDSAKGRGMKLYHYISVYEKYYNCMPNDLDKFVRTEKDIPMMMKDKVKEYLDKKGWKPREEIPHDPTLLY